MTIASRSLAALVLGAALLTGCAAPDEAREPIPTTSAERPVIVQLFEWRWADVAQECETFLGPNGFAAVQVSSPVENSVVEGRPWWERYQPVSYTLETRSGDRAAFADMVERCADAGVEIHVDAVINHMTGVYSGIGTAGSTFGEYEYPGLYDYDDFHHCGLTEGDEIEDWTDPVQVRTCELVNLADLRTDAEHVRDSIATYLNDLVGLGVRGFRVDAARHMAPEDVIAIFERVDGDPLVYQEVIDPNPPEWSEPYYPVGLVTEFQYGSAVSAAFAESRLDELHGEGSVWSERPMLPSGEALAFIDNHDNQRSHGSGHVATYKDGPLYDLNVAFMLAYPYGTPRVMSSYAFEEDRTGPPTIPGTEQTLPVHADGTVDCGGDAWVCEHRRPAIAGMVGFNNATASVPEVTDWWAGSGTQIAFGRGDRGFVAINRDEAAPLSETLATSLAPGTYCNVTDGGLGSDGACQGTPVTVAEDGTVQVDVPPMTVWAIHAGSKRD